MPTGTPLSPEDFDWFCRNVLLELGTYRYLVDQGEKKAVAEVFGVSGQSVGQRVAAHKAALAQWIDGGSITNPRYKKTVPTAAGRLLFNFATEILNRSQVFIDDLVHLQQGHVVRVATIDSAWRVYQNKLLKLL